jgi:hypothetical protein
MAQMERLDSASGKFSLMENPFKPSDNVSTKVKGAEVSATVVQTFNNEVQVKTGDGKLLWRTMHRVWYPRSAPIPKPAKTPVRPAVQPASAPEPSPPVQTTDSVDAASVEPASEGAEVEAETAPNPMSPVEEAQEAATESVAEAAPVESAPVEPTPVEPELQEAAANRNSVGRRNRKSRRQRKPREGKGSQP